ncbi:MAG: DeoR/GlpR transcriptional regulator [Pirellulales bacterium]|nr:DeoR/GlpR transcriptional regulator [Pirellulales bacterium]
MLAEERRTLLLELVRQRRFASLPELVEQLQVSESTVRRDLEHLESQGTAKRIHGGVLYSGTSPKLPHFEQQAPGQWDKKRAIARRAAELVNDGDTILLDGGSTTYEVARLLVGRSIHVVTTSLPVANLFAADAKSDLVFIGGNICPRSGVAQGPLADEMLARLRVRRTMLSVAAINEEGFFNNNLMLVETERAMMRAADEVIVVADSSKLGHQSMTHLCGLGDVQHVVVDAEITDEWKARFVSAGVTLTVAEMTNDSSPSEPHEKDVA